MINAKTEPIVLEHSNVHGYPRLQVNRLGEIVLALRKTEGPHGLTTGIFVAKTPECRSTWPIGTVWQDWEVMGPLTDYDGEVILMMRNKE